MSPSLLSLFHLVRFAAAATFVAQIPLVDPCPCFNDEESATASLASFIASEGPIALQGVLNNIGSGGALAPGVEAGLVVASSSRANPDCQCAFYQLISKPQTFPSSQNLFSLLEIEMETYDIEGNASTISIVSSAPLQPLTRCCSLKTTSFTRYFLRLCPLYKRKTYRFSRLLHLVKGLRFDVQGLGRCIHCRKFQPAARNPKLHLRSSSASSGLKPFR